MRLVFLLQWVGDLDLERMRAKGTLFYDYERMEKMLSDSFEAGRKRGDQEGRVALRKLLIAEREVL